MKHQELTAKIKDLHPAHEAQLTNYLKATGIEVGLLINFGEKVEIKRKVFTPPEGLSASGGLNALTIQKPEF
jgi:hypothetical protein